MPLNSPPQWQQPKNGEKDEEGFKKVNNRRKAAKRIPNPNENQNPKTANRFETLSEETEEAEERLEKGEKSTLIQETKNTQEDLGHLADMVQPDIDEGGSNAEAMELGELDLEGIEKACDNLKMGYIPFNHLFLFKEALIKTKGSRGLGVVSDSMK